jgi:hypothetical protein
MARKSVSSRIQPKEEVTGVDKHFIVEEENPKSNNEPEIIIESKPTPKIESNPNYNPIINPASNPIIEKVKYTDSRTQRAFYYDDKLIRIFDENYPASKFNKSAIMNELLRKFLVENGKI